MEEQEEQEEQDLQTWVDRLEMPSSPPTEPSRWQQLKALMHSPDVSSGPRVDASLSEVGLSALDARASR
eukprot:1659954-Pyramimonas_sp.AAC.1